MTHRNLPEALRQLSIGTPADWVAAGLTHAQVRALLQRGDLVRVRGMLPVYAIEAYAILAEHTPPQRAAVQALAVLAASRSRSGAASHETAAQIHELDLLTKPPGDQVTVTRQPGSFRGTGKGVRFHAAAIPGEYVMVRYGVRVTSPARTVSDLARTLPFIDAVVTAESCLRQGKATRQQFAAALAVCSRWPGAEQARRVIEFADNRTESAFESSARVVFSKRGIPAPELQVEIPAGDRKFRVDFYWPAYRTIAEADGMAKYEDKRKALDQLRRDELLRATGRDIIHFTWHDLFRDENRLIKRLLASFTRPRPS